MKRAPIRSVNASFYIASCLSASLFGGACTNTSFSGSKQVPAASPQPRQNSPQTPNTNRPLNTESLTSVDCEAEKKSNPISVKIVADAPNHIVTLSPACSSVSTNASTLSIKEPLDILIVLDITGSMQDNIDSVRQNIQAFTRKLIERGWDARFGAIPYRDKGDPVPASVPFGSVSVLEQQLNSWKADYGGEDEQEGGQDALLSAIKMYKETARPKARKDILFVTDAASYAPYLDDRSNFSTDSLSKSFKESGLKNLQLFCSAPSTAYAGSLPGFEPDSGFLLLGAVPVPSSQCTEIRSKSSTAENKLLGENLPFPLTASVLLDQFAARFEVVNSSETTTCTLVSATLDGTPLSLGDAANPRISLGKADILNGSTPPRILSVQRCCKVSSKDIPADSTPTTCANPQTKTLQVSVIK